jgi:hypothetical protein
VFKEDSIGSEMVRFVDMVLLAHQGSILIFELDCEAECGEAIVRWLSILSQNGIKDLHLNFGTYGCCNIPSSLFSCHKLVYLEISKCIINAPQCFQGLKLLRSLKLSACDLNGITLETLVSSCPMLESLELPDFLDGGSLVIRAPNLKSLDFVGWFTDIYMETPKLISARIYLDGVLEEPTHDGYESKLLRILGQLPNIEELVIGGTFALVRSILEIASPQLFFSS